MLLMRRLLLVSLSLVFVSTTAAKFPPKPKPGLDGAPQVTQQFEPNAVPPARFADPERKAKLAAAFPEIDHIFREWAQQQPVPGLAWGIIIDGELVHANAVGFRNLEAKAPMTVDSVSRIASMTKSFTAVAIMKLRDEGKLSLDDPVAQYVPELASLRYPTKDSPLLTIRHLLSHNEGFPEDNPWGDRQLAIPPATMSAWMKASIPFSNAPGVAFEYSNYGFAILGQVVARVSGMPYRDYVDKNILQPLGMTSTKWEEASVPDRVATGYKRDGENWIPEVPLPDGTFGAMGGLYSSVPDLARWVSLFLSAYPPRDDPYAGPLRRSSLRLMQTPVSPQRASARRQSVDSPLLLTAVGYGFGLFVRQTCRFGHAVSHGGGLPGFGSLMSWLPEYGVGIVSLANRTYAGPGRPTTDDVFEALARTGALKPRVQQPSQALLNAQASVDQLYAKWSDDALKRIAADNLFLDRALDLRRKDFAELREKHGDCRPGQGSAIEAKNALRGEWKLFCDRGQVRIGITLAPTTKPTIQDLETASVLPLGPKLAPLAAALASRIGTPSPNVADLLAPGVDAAPVSHTLVAASAWGSCRVGEVWHGGGDTEARVRFDCDHGPLDVSLALDAASGKLNAPTISPAAGEVCVP
jgi:CubicO group peptidase (beta-lactamase class C family)